MKQFHWLLCVAKNRPRSIYQYSNMAPRLSGQTSIFGVVFFVSKSLLGIERQLRDRDVTAIRKRLLRSAIERRSKELKKLEAERDRILNKLRSILNSVDFYLLQNALHSNIRKTTSKVIETHAKKLKGLTRFKTLPFKAEETVTNISSVKLTSEQLGVLKNGLTHSICPPSAPYINKSDVYTCFELIHRSVLRNIIDKGRTGIIKATLSQLAHSYIASH